MTMSELVVEGMIEEIHVLLPSFNVSCFRIDVSNDCISVLSSHGGYLIGAHIEVASRHVLCTMEFSLHLRFHGLQLPPSCSLCRLPRRKAWYS